MGSLPECPLTHLLRRKRDGPFTAQLPSRREVSQAIAGCRVLALTLPSDATQERRLRPTFRRPDVGEVCDPLLVGALCGELAIEDIGCNDQAFAYVVGKSATAWTCS